MNSADLGLFVVAESKGTLCGYASASYKWRAEFCGETWFAPTRPHRKRLTTKAA